MGKKSKVNKIPKKGNIRFNISNFQSKDYYLFIVTHFTYLVHGINDLNTIKPNFNEIKALQSEIQKIKDQNIINTNKNIIQILPYFFDVFCKMEKSDLSKSIYAKNVEYIFNDLKRKNRIITLK